jgi:hypothetical protein
MFNLYMSNCNAAKDSCSMNLQNIRYTKAINVYDPLKLQGDITKQQSLIQLSNSK